MLVLDEEGARIGEFLTADAIALAEDRGLDLVEVQPTADPPVCRIGDWGKMKYERQKKQRSSKSTGSTMKELKIRPKTGDHDLEVKIKRAREFLESGNRVTITVWFRGREHAHHDIGADQCMRVADAVQDVARIELPPRMLGRNMQMVLTPN